ncbi:MAG: MoaD/ThiS family protein [Actinomycetales bacterium]
MPAESTTHSVTVRYFGGAAAAAGVEQETIADCSTLAELLAHACADHPDLVPVLAASSVLVDGVASADPQTPVTRAETVDVLPPFAGG